ncbi:MAG: DUF2510 domain-containing protein [Mycobacterium sp.]|nr:DUF2510 domain-containing protein [Mycobacterium sp.]
MAVLAGWYPDPTRAAAYRFWDGRQWTAALATPTVVAVQIVAPPAPRDWCQRHPGWTTLSVFWVACMVWQWAWLVPLLVVVALGNVCWRWDRRRRDRLAAAADRQNTWALTGDERGIFGEFPPAVTENP